jgi:hypothetical protein
MREYRIQSQSPEPLLTLLEFPASPPGTGLFVRLPDAQPQEAVLPTPPPGSSNFLENGGTIEIAQAIAGYHRRPNFTNRTNDEITLDEVEGVRV